MSLPTPRRQILNHGSLQKRQNGVPVRVATVVRRGIPVLLAFYLTTAAFAQELQPRAYLPAPVGLDYFSISYSNNSGGLLFDPSLPVENAHVEANSPAVAFGETLNVFGRTGQALAVLPYVVADLSGTAAGVQQSRHRSGLADALLRFAVNIHGAPAMHLPEFVKYRPKTIIGASISVTTPTGQYDPNVLINPGANRWAFKPEIGISHSAGKWDFEADFGVWLFSKNSNFYGSTFREQDPLGSVQVHVVRMLPRRIWVAFDGTFYTGGRSYVGETVKADYQGSTRFGATLSIPLSRRQALRFAYFDGVTARIGSDISSISVAYQIIWHNGR
jgi:hypothetical protein